MTFTDNLCSGASAKGTMVLEGIIPDYVFHLTISKSSFINNKSPRGAAIYSSLSLYLYLIDLTIIDNTNTE